MTNQTSAGKIAATVLNPCTNDSRVIKQAEALSKAGYKVKVFCLWKPGLPEKETINKVEYIRLKLLGKNKKFKDTPKRRAPLNKGQPIYKMKTKNILSALLSTFKNLASKCTSKLLKNTVFFVKFFIFYPNVKKHLENWEPDFIHCHDLNTLCCGYFYKKKHNVKVIYDSHELEQHRNPPLNLAKKQYVRLIEHIFSRQADAIITVSDKIKQHLEKELKRSNILVIYNSPKSTPITSRNLRKEIGIDNKTILLTYIVAIIINRGLEQTIAAMHMLPSFHLALIGPVTDKNKAEFKKIIQLNNLNDRIHFVEPVHSFDVVSFISSTNIGIIPIQNACLSYDYCMPNKLFELSFANIPIAASNLTSIKQFINKIGNGVIFDESNPEDIAKKVQHLLNNREKYLIKQPALLNEYSWSHQEEKLIKLYNSFR